jgi:anti-anti-sigma factor
LTIDSARYVRREVLNLLTQRPREALVLDMEGVTYMDAAGIVILLEAVIAARQFSVKLRVAGLAGQPRRLAEITELSTIFASAESEVI